MRGAPLLPCHSLLPLLLDSISELSIKRSSDIKTLSSDENGCTAPVGLRKEKVILLKLS